LVLLVLYVLYVLALVFLNDCALNQSNCERNVGAWAGVAPPMPTAT